jgi:thiol-disulfide isomerase/thioredoxin
MPPRQSWLTFTLSMSHYLFVLLVFIYLLHHKCSYYHTRWCGPCKTLGPRLEALAAEKLDKFHLAKVDIDNVPELAEEYNVCLPDYIILIKSIPI